MKRIQIQPRNNWQAKVEKLGFGFHSTNVPYWNEGAYYEFSMDEILHIEKATEQLWEMCLNTVQMIIDEKLYSQFHIPEWFIPQIEKSWNEDRPAIYNRFDLAYKDGEIKMLEINADTPTSLYEAGIIQWFWLKDFDENKDQFNSIHEKLIEYWAHLKEYLYARYPLHFTCVKRSLEDLTTVEYLRDCAMQAKLDTKLVFIDDIGWHDGVKKFVDLEGDYIKNIFKLYPWEWLINEEFGKNILLDTGDTNWIEPAWKMLLSNKAILPFLWSMYPNNPLLLKSYFDVGDLVSYAKKPILSREGANVELVKYGSTIEQTLGTYGAEGYVYQELFELPEFDKNYPVLGSWVIGQQAAGMGIRESDTMITGNTSRFVPHLIK